MLAETMPMPNRLNRLGEAHNLDGSIHLVHSNGRVDGAQSNRSVSAYRNNRGPDGEINVARQNNQSAYQLESVIGEHTNSMGLLNQDYTGINDSR